MNPWLIVLVLTQCLGIARAELKWDRQRVELTAGPTDPFVEATFAFVNVGKEPVIIEKLESSCGCATASLPKMTIAPGERSELRTRFTIGGRRGLQNKTVTVRIKGETVPVVLALVVSIPDLVKIEPPLVIWEKGEAPNPKTISLQAMEGQVVKIVNVVSSEPTVIVKLETVREGREYVIVVTPKDTAKTGFSVLSISAEHQGQKPTLSAYAQVKAKQK